MIKTKWMLIIRTEAYLRVFPTVPFGTPRVSSELRCSTGMSLTEALPWTRITFVIGDGDRGCGGHENGGGIMISVKLIIMKIMTIYDDTQLPTIAIHCSAPSCVWRLPRWPSWPHSSWCQTLPRGQHRHHHSHNQESIHWSQTPIWKIIIMIIMILCRQCLAPLVRWTLFLARLASTILSTTRVGSWIMVPYIRPSWFPVPDTGFDCADQTVPGFYTDPAADCQVFEEISNSTWIWLFSTYFQSFYMCTPGGDEASFLCPNGTSNDLILLKNYDNIGFPFNRCYY